MTDSEIVTFHSIYFAQ